LGHHSHNRNHNELDVFEALRGIGVGIAGCLDVAEDQSLHGFGGVCKKGKRSALGSAFVEGKADIAPTIQVILHVPL